MASDKLYLVFCCQVLERLFLTSLNISLGRFVKIGQILVIILVYITDPIYVSQLITIDLVTSEDVYFQFVLHDIYVRILFDKLRLKYFQPVLTIRIDPFWSSYVGVPASLGSGSGYFAKKTKILQNYQT